MFELVINFFDSGQLFPRYAKNWILHQLVFCNIIFQISAWFPNQELCKIVLKKIAYLLLWVSHRQLMQQQCIFHISGNICKSKLNVL
jgi:hypothetical protein